MNRNVESHFSTIPTMKHQRSVFDRSFSNKTTFNAGEVIPIYTQEVLPGDSVKLNCSKVVRAQTMLAPVYDNMYLDTYFFFVPNRLTWRHWKEFMGENTTSAWIPQVEYTVPTIGAPAGGFATGTIADYMGFPVGADWSKDDLNAPIALPFRALALICNDFFRDQNLTDPLVTDDSDNNTVGSNGDGLADVVKGGKPFKAAKYHDYFTSCLPQPQKGPTVAVPGWVDGAWPVMPGIAHPVHNVYKSASSSSITNVPMTITNVSQSSRYAIASSFNDTATPKLTQDIQDGRAFDGEEYWIAGTDQYGHKVPVYTGSTTGFTPNNLWAVPVLATPSGGENYHVGFDISALRLATVTQMYYETLARSGSRYEEQIEAFFGVRNPDSRMNHPEFLGGNRVRINVHEITNTAQSEQDFLGDVGAKSVTADSAYQFSKSFTEHGWIIGVCVVRYDHSYHQGMPAQFMRKDKFDYYNPMFAEIGEQPVKTAEIYYKTHSNDPQVFGYQEAWASYRYANNMATGELRPGVNASLGHWTLTDNYTATPTLSDGWIREDKSNVDRALAVSSSLANQFFADFYFESIWTRPMPMYSVPGAIGAF